MGAIRPIFDFESVFDLDLTMIELIQEKFKGSKFFNSVMDEDPMVVRLLLRNRQEYNPLSIIINDEYKDSIDDLYKEILTKYADEIYGNTSFTELSRLFSTLTISDKSIINISMICRNRYEDRLAKLLSIKSPINIVRPPAIEQDMFDAWFIKNLNAIDLYCPDMKSKTIFLLDYGFNVEYILGQIIPKEWIHYKYGIYNEIIISQIYSQLAYPSS